jgi:hypothetical protein
MRAWKRHSPPLLKALETLALFKATAQWQGENGRFIPHPATWLNRHGWNDEAPAPMETVL